MTFFCVTWNIYSTKQVKKGHELLNCDQHGHIIAKHGLDKRVIRPDIVYKCLITLFSSPLNWANLLQVTLSLFYAFIKMLMIFLL